LAGLFGLCRGFSRDSYQVLPSRVAALAAFKKNPENSAFSFQLSAVSLLLVYPISG
jgi:hypothetical protein